MSTSSKLSKILTYAAALVILAIYIVPFILIFLTSIKDENESKIMDLSLPTTYMLENYATAFNQGQIWRGFSNGMFISTVVTLLTVLLCSYSAFIIQRNRNAFTSFTYKFLLAGMIAPFSFIPAIKLLQLLNMGNDFSGLIMVDLAGQIPFSILIYYSFTQGIPREMDEASVVDGCGPLRMFFQVIFPLLLPVVSTNIVLTFTAIWNDFGNVLFLVPKTSMWTMPMGVFNFQQLYTYNYGLVCAYVTIALIPVLAIYLIGQKYIISGMTTGAVKG